MLGKVMLAWEQGHMGNPDTFLISLSLKAAQRKKVKMVNLMFCVCEIKN